MKKERSSGGIIVRTYRGMWQVLLIEDMNRTWTFPKGKIEKAETRIEAAEREILEEVGLSPLTYVCGVKTIHYTYKRNGLIDKTVFYALFTYAGHKKPVCQKEEGIKRAQWFGFAEARENVGYRVTNVPLLAKSEVLVKSL